MTRFNIRVTDDDSAARHLDPAWLLSRLELFESTCIPSVDAARHPRLRWLVASDTDTPPDVAERLQQLARGRFEVVATNGVVGPTTWAPMVCERARSEQVLTTRLDSDDAIGERTLRAVHDRALTITERSGAAPRVLSCPFGHQVDGSRCYRRIYLQNPFISLLERAETCRTVLSFQHHDLRGRKVTYLPVRDAWFQFLNGDNLANEVRGIRTRGDHARRALRRAGVDLDEPESGDDWAAEFLRTTADQVGQGVRAVPRLTRLLRR